MQELATPAATGIEPEETSTEPAVTLKDVVSTLGPDKNYGGSITSTEYPMAELVEMGGISAETGLSVWDPLLLASPLNGAHASKLKWYRQAEIKHGRVAMAACVGWAAAYSGVTFNEGLQGLIVPEDPLATWSNIPFDVKLGFLLTGGFVETRNEMQKPHYLRGGKLGDVPIPFGWDPLNLMRSKTDEMKKVSLDAELKNGRLAMLGIASFYFASTIPGSVPWKPF